jgi:hypothetical protein
MNDLRLCIGYRVDDNHPPRRLNWGHGLSGPAYGRLSHSLVCRQRLHPPVEELKGAGHLFLKEQVQRMGRAVIVCSGVLGTLPGDKELCMLFLCPWPPWCALAKLMRALLKPMQDLAQCAVEETHLVELLIGECV